MGYFEVPVSKELIERSLKEGAENSSFRVDKGLPEDAELVNSDFSLSDGRLRLHFVSSSTADKHYSFPIEVTWNR